MGIYVNSKNAYALYKKETVKPYFIDKTRILNELFPLVEEGSNYLCITRPRRFGKTVMANMIAAFFSQRPIKRNNKFITSKEDKNLHGYGLKSVQRIVEKYDGIITYETENKIFTTSLSFFDM